ncbi:MAG TPA: NlpC/P60 family protein [Kofleriaceae bacterium]
MGRDDLIRDLRRLDAHYRTRYGTPIFDLRARFTGRDALITGEVLLPAQLVALQRIARRHPQLHGHHEVSVLAATRPTTYGVANDAVVDVHEHARAGAKLATQITADDPAFEILTERHGRYLVRLDCGALGWIDDKDTRLVATPMMQASRPGDGHHLVDEGLSYLGVPYLTGGCTRVAIDCSAIIQRVFRSVLGLVVPRNTRDQMRHGRAVSLARSRPGDVVFLRGPLGVHTGMFLRDGRVLHASYRHHKIVIDTLGELRRSLRFTTIRRFAEAR